MQKKSLKPFQTDVFFSFRRHGYGLCNIAVGEDKISVGVDNLAGVPLDITGVERILA